MKRIDFEKHLAKNGCRFHHAGGKHDVWINVTTLKKTTIPRHREIPDSLAKAICKQLDVSRV